MKTKSLLHHYSCQIESIRAAEIRLLDTLAWLNRCAPALGLTATLAGMESCCRSRLDWLRSITDHRAVGPALKPQERRDHFLESAMFEFLQSTGEARSQALANCICASLDRQLINAYRVARALAAGLDLDEQVISRLDALMGSLSDRSLCWKSVPAKAELQHEVFVSG